MFAVCRAVGSVVLVAGSVAAANAANGLPKLLGDAPHGALTWQVRPIHIVYTGDGSGVLGGFDGTGARHALHPGHLIWSSWTRTLARGSGAVWLDNCVPDCASGKFTAYALKVVAFRPIHGHFTRLTLTYTYDGKRDVDKRGIIRNGGSWMYYIVGYPPFSSAGLQPMERPCVAPSPVVSASFSRVRSSPARLHLGRPLPLH